MGSSQLAKVPVPGDEPWWKKRSSQFCVEPVELDEDCSNWYESELRDVRKPVANMLFGIHHSAKYLHDRFKEAVNSSADAGTRLANIEGNLKPNLLAQFQAAYEEGGTDQYFADPAKIGRKSMLLTIGRVLSGC